MLTEQWTCFCGSTDRILLERIVGSLVEAKEIYPHTDLSVFELPIRAHESNCAECGHRYYLAPEVYVGRNLGSED